MAQNPMEWNMSIERKIPSDATIYLSYVLGDATQRANAVVLSREEIKKRMQHLKRTKGPILLVTLPENRPAYDEYVLKARKKIFNSIIKIKTEPVDDVENQPAAVASVLNAQNGIKIKEEPIDDGTNGGDSNE